MSKGYNTKQKQIILDYIKTINKEFKIKDIYDALKNEIGLTTIYRMVDSMYDEGLLNKTINKDNEAYYQYLEKCNEHNHFYLKCEKCGDMVHIDCDCIEELSNHIYSKHSFIPNRDNIIINGICSKCNRR